MSDNSSGSTGSSTNSWTLLSPEEAGIDPAAPLDDGTESVGEAPSLSEEIAGSPLEVRSQDPETPLLEPVLSEEGHQVSASPPICQETSPEFLEELSASGSAEVEQDPEIHAPVIHDTITSSPPDSDLLGSVPFSIATESALQFSEEPILEPTEEDISDDFPTQHVPVQESPILEQEPKITSTPEPFRESSPSPDDSDITPGISHAHVTLSSAIPVFDIHADVHATPETPPVAPPTEADTGFGSTLESPAPESPYPETIGLVETEEESVLEKEEIELPEKFPDVIREPESLGPELPADTSIEDDGLRRRYVQPTVVLKQSSDEEEEEGEEEFTLPPRKEEKRAFSLTQLIVGALVLLCLGSFFFSGSVFDQTDDDLDGGELSDQELLDKLAQENKQINILEAQIETQRQELDRALKRATETLSSEKGVLENENIKLKEQLSLLPGLKEELQTLRAHVAELTKLTAEGDRQTVPDRSPPSTVESVPKEPERTWDKKEELKRQKALLEESRKRLEGMKKQGLRESLVEVQKRLFKQVDQLGKREDRKSKHKGEKKDWGRKKEQDSHWKEEEERGKEWKHGKDKQKEHHKKFKEEWDHKREERKQEREQRHNERSSKHHHEERDFWKQQEEKLRRNRRPAERCNSVFNCAEAEGLVPVKLEDFQDLLRGYTSKLEAVPHENKKSLVHLTSQFFSGGVFTHDRMLFSEFAEDVADILEDLADESDNDSLEEEMEEFEREALLKFAAPLV
ncbi:hypothetical protein DNTS_032055 [Danionella cerebrum]|uniref:Pre-B-cell leukemia transcription factor-interacting protein 1-like n=1 Tax=Danionella cerebrum TaxID=2873325 RepID=A0A553P9L2_9TELE|nr:hypothetical protein DNTS_032055 [Danionella translucida]TRY74367.1 hypothetical protein DNTS_032055 [Danionella translucida]